MRLMIKITNKKLIKRNKNKINRKKKKIKINKNVFSLIHQMMKKFKLLNIEVKVRMDSQHKL